MDRLHQIQRETRLRAEEIVSRHPEWPCRKGCDECCRRLAAAPIVTRPEWQLIAAALDLLPERAAQAARRRIRDSATASRPVTCPLLDTGAGTCMVYGSRPVACRAYGFYAERDSVLGCSRIEAMSRQCPGVVWGNHETLEDRLNSLGEAAPLSAWLAEGS